MQKTKDSLERDIKERVLEVMHKLDVGNAKLEQCAFDCINATDEVMMAMTDVMLTIQETMDQQGELMSAVESLTSSMADEEGESLLCLARAQSALIAKLENELQKAVAATLEANDSARCVEACIVEQSDNVNNLELYSEEMLS